MPDMTKIREHAKTLAELGAAIARMRFSYKVKDSTEKTYWIKRAMECETYFEKTAAYYNEAYLLMKIIDTEESKTFLLALSKLHQLKKTQMNLLEKIAENPTVMKSKDRQQSRWSKDARDDMTSSSNRCLEHEKRMSAMFREFVESHRDLLA